MVDVSSVGIRHLLNDMISLHARTMSKPLPGWASSSEIICVRQPALPCSQASNPARLPQQDLAGHVVVWEQCSLALRTVAASLSA